MTTADHRELEPCPIRRTAIYPAYRHPYGHGEAGGRGCLILCGVLAALVIPAEVVL